MTVSDETLQSNHAKNDIDKTIALNAIADQYKYSDPNKMIEYGNQALQLAQKINSTEATVYRYFSSKHKLLTYILNWYWSYIEFISKLRLQEIKEPLQKMEKLKTKKQIEFKG